MFDEICLWDLLTHWAMLRHPTLLADDDAMASLCALFHRFGLELVRQEKARTFERLCRETRN